MPSGATRILSETDPYDHCNFTVLDGAPGVLLDRFQELLLGMRYEDAKVRPLETVVVQALALYGVAGDEGLAYAVTLHLIHYVPGTLLGLAFAWKSGLRLGELRAAARAPSAAEPCPASTP